MKLVILDRDGTINEDRDDFVKSAEEWVPLPGALEAIARLNHAGWHTVIATNQSGLARGLFRMAGLNGIHARMNRELAALGGRIDAIFFCPHGPDDGCDCRKPLPGLFTRIAERYGIELQKIPAVGDSLRDLQASAAAGALPHLVRTGKCAGLDDDAVADLCAEVPGTTVHADLGAFATHLIVGDRQQRGSVDEPDSLFGKLS